MKEMSPLLYPRRWVRLQSSILFLVSIAGLADPSSSPSEFKVLPGFEVSVAAASPLVNYPMMACLDDRGRLYIAESDGRNLTTREEIEKERPRFVRRLVDQDGDGVFDTSTIFADEMTMPEGGLWHQGALYIILHPISGGWRIWMMTVWQTNGKRSLEVWNLMEEPINMAPILAPMADFILQVGILVTI